MLSRKILVLGVFAMLFAFVLSNPTPALAGWCDSAFGAGNCLHGTVSLSCDAGANQSKVKAQYTINGQLLATDTCFCGQNCNVEYPSAATLSLTVDVKDSSFPFALLERCQTLTNSPATSATNSCTDPSTNLNATATASTS